MQTIQCNMHHFTKQCALLYTPLSPMLNASQEMFDRVVHIIVQMSLWLHMTGQLGGRVMTAHYGIVIPPWGGRHFQLNQRLITQAMRVRSHYSNAPTESEKEKVSHGMIADPVDQYLAGLTIVVPVVVHKILYPSLPSEEVRR